MTAQPAQGRKAEKAHAKQQDDPLDDMAVFEMSQFMRQHRVHFARVQLLEQGVIEHHAFGCTKAGEVGVGVGAAFTAVHHKQAFGVEAAALHQRSDPLHQFGVLQRLKAVEPGCDEGRVNHHGQKVEGHPGRPNPQPPQRPGRAHQP